MRLSFIVAAAAVLLVVPAVHADKVGQGSLTFQSASQATMGLSVTISGSDASAIRGAADYYGNKDGSVDAQEADTAKALLENLLREHGFQTLTGTNLTLDGA